MVRGVLEQRCEFQMLKSLKEFGKCGAVKVPEILSSVKWDYEVKAIDAFICAYTSGMNSWEKLIGCF